MRCQRVNHDHGGVFQQSNIQGTETSHSVLPLPLLLLMLQRRNNCGCGHRHLIRGPCPAPATIAFPPRPPRRETFDTVAGYRDFSLCGATAATVSYVSLCPRTTCCSLLAPPFLKGQQQQRFPWEQPLFPRDNRTPSLPSPTHAMLRCDHQPTAQSERLALRAQCTTAVTAVSLLQEYFC